CTRRVYRLPQLGRSWSMCRDGKGRSPSRYLWLCNEPSLSAESRAQLSCSDASPTGNGARVILAWFDSRIANGLIESINSLVQAAKAKARGYRSLRNLAAITS